MALAFGMMSFTSSSISGIEKSLLTEENNQTEIIEKDSFCDYFIRTCTYRNGELIGCTDWECGFRTDKIVIVSKKN